NSGTRGTDRPKGRSAYARSLSAFASTAAARMAPGSHPTRPAPADGGLAITGRSLLSWRWARMTRTKPVRYKLAIQCPANGRVRQADIQVLDGADKILFTDRADLAAQVELEKVANRLAPRLGVTPKKFHKQLERSWADALNRDRERQQQQE